MGGVIWLAGSDPDDLEALVGQDPSGETNLYFWTLNDHSRGADYNEHIVGEGACETMAEATAAAIAAFETYEEER